MSMYEPHEPEHSDGLKDAQQAGNSAKEEQESVSASYNATMEKASGLAIGPNPVSNIINNYRVNPDELRTMFKEVLGLAFEERGLSKNEQRSSREDSTNDTVTTILRENLQYEKQYVASESEATTITLDSLAKLPASSEAIEDWYTSLNDYKQCFVQVAAVLHGAPLDDIISIVDKLYQPIREAAEERQAEQTAKETGQVQAAISPEALRRPSRRELLAHTLTTTRRVNGVNRLFWQDADKGEQYIFSLRILNFLAEETGFLVQSDFREQLLHWPELLAGECSWKSAHALGVILWSQSTDELWRQANRWANSTRPRDWRLVASLLNGAYEIDQLEHPQTANDTQKSPIFRLLNQWVERAQANSNVRVGCSAAHAYSIIGKRRPDIALVGLDSLLRFPNDQSRSNWETMPLDIFLVSVSNYLGLAWSGHIRKILAHLATHATALSFQHHRPSSIIQLPKYRLQRDINLAALNDIFFLIAASSLASSLAEPTISYDLTETLPENPSMPDTTGRDILLVGVLSVAETSWYECIMIILCSAIFHDKQGRAYWLMYEWAKIVASDTSTNAEELQDRYIQFLVNVGTTVAQWYHNMQTAKLGPPPVLEGFKYKLGLWKRQRYKQPTDALVQAVLSQLTF